MSALPSHEGNRTTKWVVIVALALSSAALVPRLPHASGAGGCQVTIAAPADLNAGFRNAPEGAVICLSGTFRVSKSLVPRAGQQIRGPAVIDNAGGVENGFDLLKAPNVTIVDLEIKNFTRRGVKCATGTKVLHSELHHNRQNGVGCALDNRAGSGIVIADNAIHSNGVSGQEGGTVAGMKFVRSGMPGGAPGSSVTVRNNDVWSNFGNGIWFDINSAGDLIEGNRVWGNSRNGIRYEISGGPAIIRDNVVRDNRLYGIWVTSSAKVVVTANTSVNNAKRDIVIMSEERAVLTFPELGGSHDGYTIVDIDVYGNVVTRPVVGCTLQNVSCSAPRKPVTSRR